MRKWLDHLERHAGQPGVLDVVLRMLGTMPDPRSDETRRLWLDDIITAAAERARKCGPDLRARAIELDSERIAKMTDEFPGIDGAGFAIRNAIAKRAHVGRRAKGDERSSETALVALLRAVALVPNSPKRDLDDEDVRATIRNQRSSRGESKAPRARRKE